MGTSTAAAMRTASSRFFRRWANFCCFFTSSYSTSTLTPNKSCFDFGSRIINDMFTNGSTVSGLAIATKIRSSSFFLLVSVALSSANAILRAACSVIIELTIQENNIRITIPFNISSFIRNCPGATSIFIPTITIANAPAA